MAAFEYRQAEELHAALSHCGVHYLFLGKSAAILLGFPDTTQDVDVFPQRSIENGRALAGALRNLGFTLTVEEVHQIERGKVFIQLKNGPFDVDLIFAPDGIDSFETAWHRRVQVADFPVCHPDDIIASAKRDASLPRLTAFRDYWMSHGGAP